MAERRYDEEALARELRVSTLIGQVYTHGVVEVFRPTALGIFMWFVSGYGFSRSEPDPT
jgi:hypothetical protein